MKFTEKLRTTAESYVKKIQAKEKEIADHHKEGIKTYSQAKYQEIQFELQEQRNDLHREAMAAINAIIDEFKAELTRRYVAKGDELNTGDMTLLNSGYKLSLGDLEAMFDRYAPAEGMPNAACNHTMIRAILDYAEEHGMYLNRTYYGEKEKAAATDSLKQYALNCFQRPDFGMETEAYFAQIFPEALAGD
ncbi:MAG: hypothetical protein E7439_02275 [Ruminococcaceae bacterium]|nr:hypothetical protein [Oscillospiraceae bacterium]